MVERWQWCAGGEQVAVAGHPGFGGVPDDDEWHVPELGFDPFAFAALGVPLVAVFKVEGLRD